MKAIKVSISEIDWKPSRPTLCPTEESAFPSGVWGEEDVEGYLHAGEPAAEVAEGHGRAEITKASYGAVSLSAGGALWLMC